MNPITLQQQIELWKSLPEADRSVTDEFIDDLIARIEELAEINEDLADDLWVARND